MHYLNNFQVGEANVQADWLPSHWQVCPDRVSENYWCSVQEMSHSLRPLQADCFFHPACQGLSLAGWGDKRRPSFSQLFSTLTFQQIRKCTMTQWFCWVSYGLNRYLLYKLRTGRSSRAGWPVQWEWVHCPTGDRCILTPCTDLALAGMEKDQRTCKTWLKLVSKLLG